MTDTPIDIVKIAIDWTKAEMFSSALFAVFGIICLLACFGFWQMGKTDMARAYIIPLLIVGILLVILGVGLVLPNQWRLSHVPAAYNADASAFIAAEIAKADKTMAGYSNAIFKVIPLIIASCAVLIIFLEAPIWRASLISVIAMMAVLMLIDTNANARLGAYKEKLELAQKQ